VGAVSAPKVTIGNRTINLETGFGNWLIFQR
jgi:hypothetical protein